MYNDNLLSSEQQQQISYEAISDKEEFKKDDEDLSSQRADELNRLYAEASLPHGFYIDNEGWLAFEKDDKDASSIRICSRLEVIARTRDQIGENHGRLLQFSDPDGVNHKWAMPMEMLAGDGLIYRQTLLSKGLLIAPGKQARQLLTTFIQTSNPPTTVRCVEQTGWNKERTAFVFQNETIGSTGGESLILQTKASLQASQTASGSLIDWQQMAMLCKGNSRLIFAVSAAFAPPLLLLLGMENGGIHFRGGSSSGKTTCLRAAASVWGAPDSVQQWRATANGLEGTAAANNDCLLCLDEMGQMDPNELGHVAYMLANGVGKTRADKSGDSRQCKQWRLIFLSSGEISLAAHMLEAKKQAKAGQEIRVLDIPADSQKYGCFQELHHFDLSKDFAEHISILSKSHHGIAGPMYIRALLQVQSEATQRARRSMDELSKKYVPTTASGQVHRVFNRFALIAVAGELATSFGITGWEEGVAISAAMSCFNDWLIARGDLGPQEEKIILSQVKHFFELHGESRFTPWYEEKNDYQGRTNLRAGYSKNGKEGLEFFVFPESFKKDIVAGLDSELVIKVCLKHALLMPDSGGGATRAERLPGAKKSTRVYRFTSKVLASEE